MKPNPVPTVDNQPKAGYQWSARKLQPIILLFVAVVIVAMIALAYFVVHSMTAVKALVITAVAAIVPLVPTVLMRVEYRLTGETLDRRPVDSEKPRAPEELFRLDQLSHLVPMRHGFKFYKKLEEPNPLRRFWKLHVSDEYSGEVHVEKQDQKRVSELLRKQGVIIR